MKVLTTILLMVLTINLTMAQQAINKNSETTITLKDGTKLKGTYINSYQREVLFEVDRMLSGTKNIKSDLLLIPQNEIESPLIKSSLNKFRPGQNVTIGANNVLVGIGLGLATFVLSVTNDEISPVVYLASNAISTGLVITGFAKISANAKYLDAVRY